MISDELDDDDLAAFRDDFEVFRAAHEGDLGPLIELLVGGADITAQRRELIIKVLRGDISHPPHRQKRITTTERRRSIAAFVRKLECNGKQMSAIAEAMTKFNCCERTVKNALKVEREVKATLKEMEAAARRMGETTKGKQELFWLIDKFRKKMDAEYVAMGLRKPWRRPLIFAEF